jgi:hypothetical protein
MQAIARVHRSTQKADEVHVHYMDKAAHENIKRVRAQMADILGDDYSYITS